MKPISHKLERHAEFPSGSIAMNIKANLQGYSEKQRRAERRRGGKREEWRTKRADEDESAWKRAEQSLYVYISDDHGIILLTSKKGVQEVG